MIFPSVHGNRLYRPIFAGRFRFNNFLIMLEHDSGAVAHFERDLSGVFCQRRHLFFSEDGNGTIWRVSYGR